MGYVSNAIFRVAVEQINRFASPGVIQSRVGQAGAADELDVFHELGCPESHAPMAFVIRAMGCANFERGDKKTFAIY